MHEDLWFVKAGIAGLCVLALVMDGLMATGFAAELALALAVLVLALDARRDRLRDFWHSL